jgi:hypothetical protein
MCLLVVRKANSAWKPSKQEFQNAWDINSDGFGLAYAKNGKLRISKSLDEGAAWKEVSRLPDNVPALLHWRMGTHGSVTLNNVHPFQLSAVRDVRQWVGAHNGVLSNIVCEKDKTDSETYFRTLKHIRISDVERDISKLGYGKMSFLSNSGDLLIANESQGSWRNPEVWQSNNGLDDRGFSYCGFGKNWKPTAYHGKDPILTPIECCVCSHQAVSYRDGFDFYCEGCATYPEVWR